MALVEAFEVVQAAKAKTSHPPIDDPNSSLAKSWRRKAEQRSRKFGTGTLR